jgi:hypothetical protein
VKARVSVLAAALVLVTADAALACPVCFSASDAPLVQGNGWGIATLLIITLAMLAAFAGFFMTLWRRARIAGLASDAALTAEATSSERGRC